MGKTSRRRGLLVGVPVTLVAITVAALWLTQVSASGSPDRYVTTTATTGSISQTLAGSGTVTRVTSASVSFPTSGTVTSVSVAVGDQVKAGQVLATMDGTALQAAVDNAQATLAQANDAAARAATAASAPASAAKTTSAPSATASPSAKPSTSAKAPSSGTGTSPISAQLTAARQDLDAAWTTFAKQVARASNACATPSPTPSASPAATPKPSAEPSPTAEPSPSAEPTPTGQPSPIASASPTSAATPGGSSQTTPTSSGCMTELGRLQAAEATVNTARATVDKAISALLATPSGTASGSTGSSTGPSSSSTTRSSTSSTTSASASRSTQGGSAQTVDQANAAVAQAQLNLTSAQAALKNATLTAPIDGTVASEPFVVGSAMSSSDAISILSPGADQVVLSVADTQIASVQVGQAVQVTSSAGATSAGKVVAIGMLPTASGNSPTYPVTVHIDTPDPSLAPGTTAWAQVTVASATNAVLVPVSAVTRTSTSAGTVTVLDASGAAQVARVELGAIGDTRVQITQGLAAGDKVVLADRTQALPSGNFGQRRPNNVGALPGGGQGGFGGNRPPGR